MEEGCLFVCFVSTLGLVIQFTVALRIPIWGGDWISRG